MTRKEDSKRASERARATKKKLQLIWSSLLVIHLAYVLHIVCVGYWWICTYKFLTFFSLCRALSLSFMTAAAAATRKTGALCLITLFSRAVQHKFKTQAWYGKYVPYIFHEITILYIFEVGEREKQNTQRSNNKLKCFYVTHPPTHTHTIYWWSVFLCECATRTTAYILKMYAGMLFALLRLSFWIRYINKHSTQSICGDYICSALHFVSSKNFCVFRLECVVCSPAQVSLFFGSFFLVACSQTNCLLSEIKCERNEHFSVVNMFFTRTI